MSQPQLIITLNPDKSVSVTGPFNDRLLCYALLESAKDAVRDWRPPVILPVGQMPTNLQGKEMPSPNRPRNGFTEPH